MAELQTRTLTPEFSQLERRALHTELAELGRPALTTELAQLQTSSFEESSFEASILLGGGRLETSSRRGGVLSSQLAFLPLHLDLHQLELDAILGSSFASPERKLALLSKIGIPQTIFLCNVTEYTN